MSVHVRAQIAAVEKIRDSGVPQGASVEFLEGWKAAFSAVLNDYRIFDLMPKLALTVDVTPAVALRFLEQMRRSGYEPVEDKASTDEQAFWYFKVNGETCTDFEVVLRQADGEAFIKVRPR